MWCVGLVYQLIVCSVGYFCVQVSCYCRYLVIGVYAFVLLVQSQGSTSGVTRRLSSSLGGGLMLRGTSGVPVLPTWRGRGTRGQPCGCDFGYSQLV